MILNNGKYAAKLSADSLIYFLVINRAVFFASLGPQLHANLAPGSSWQWFFRLSTDRGDLVQLLVSGDEPGGTWTRLDPFNSAKGKLPAAMAGSEPSLPVSLTEFSRCVIVLREDCLFLNLAVFSFVYFVHYCYLFEEKRMFLNAWTYRTRFFNFPENIFKALEFLKILEI